MTNTRTEGPDQFTVRDIRAVQTAKLHDLIEAVQQNPFYANKWAGMGRIPDTVSLSEFSERFPTTSKQDFLDDQATHPPFGARNAAATTSRRSSLVSMTSGSSGKGQELQFQTYSELKEMVEVYRCGYRWAGLEPGDILGITMPVTLLGGGRLEAAGAEAADLSVLPLGNYTSEEKLYLADRLGAHALIGTTSYLGRLAHTALDAVHPSQLKAVMTGGEGGGHRWMLGLAEQWGAPVYDRYGSSQAGCDHMFSCSLGLGSQSNPGVLHNIDTHVLIEVIDPDSGLHVADGESGEIVVTVLYRDKTPVIRYAMGDQGIYRAPHSCACGSPFSGVQAGSISRLDDVKKIKGVNIWPQLLDDCVLAEPGVLDYQILLTTGNKGEELAEAKIAIKSMNSTKSQRIKRNLTKAMRDATGVTFTVISEPAEEFVSTAWKAQRIVDRRDHMVEM